jgi:hypothetical protein
MYAKELTPKFADEKKYAVEAWIEEIVSGTKENLKTEIWQKMECLNP